MKARFLKCATDSKTKCLTFADIIGIFGIMFLNPIWKNILGCIFGIRFIHPMRSAVPSLVHFQIPQETLPHVDSVSGKSHHQYGHLRHGS